MAGQEPTTIYDTSLKPTPLKIEEPDKLAGQLGQNHANAK